MSIRRESFASFCKRLRVKPTAAQRIKHAVCFDGAQPRDFSGADRDIAFRLFGSFEVIPVEARGVVVWRKGARSGGTYFASLYALYLSLTLPLTTLAPGEHAFAVIVAPDLRLARQALRFIIGALGTRSELRAAIVSESTDAVTVRRDDGRLVTIECLPATRGGSALRGRSLVCAVLSEAAFFYDSSYVVNDQDVFKAVAPRVVPGGMVLIESTPWTESGLMFELDRDNFAQPSTTLVCHCPTLLMREDDATRAVVKRERDRDPDNAQREFDGEYMSAGSGLFFDQNGIRLSISSDILLPRAYDSNAYYGIGADWAFVSDSSAIVVTEKHGEIYRLAHVEEMRPAPGRPLKPSEVGERFANVAKAFHCTEIWGDHHYSEANREALTPHKISLSFVPDGQQGKLDTYSFARERMNEGRVQLADHGRLLGQLRAVVSKPTSGGGISITSPRRGGSHGDIASAWICSMWAASQAAPGVYPKPPPMRHYYSPLEGALGGTIANVAGAQETGPHAGQLARYASEYASGKYGFRQ